MNKASDAYLPSEARQAHRRSTIETQATLYTLSTSKVAVAQRVETSSLDRGSETFKSVMSFCSVGNVLGLKTGVWPAVGAVLNSIAIDDLLREHNFLKKCSCDLMHSVN